MKKNLLIIGLGLILSFLNTSCGYTTRSTLSSDIRSIHITDFKNRISYTTDGSNRNLYIPLLEVDIHKAVVDRFLFDGNLKIAPKETADLILVGELINYDRRPLRYTSGDDVEEYRIYLKVSLKLIKGSTQEVEWSEPSFVGEATYFVTGALAKSEDLAIDEAIEDLARRIVERTVEAW